jgi:hypothetical protein
MLTEKPPREVGSGSVAALIVSSGIAAVNAVTIILAARVAPGEKVAEETTAISAV